MSDLPPPPTSATPDEKAKHLLDALDLKERTVDRKTPNLLVVMAPVWIWMAGLIWLPDTMPAFAKGIFHVTCWACFGFLVFKTVQAVRLDRDVSAFKEKTSRREELEALAAKQRERKKNTSGT